MFIADNVQTLAMLTTLNNVLLLMLRQGTVMIQLTSFTL